MTSKDLKALRKATGLTQLQFAAAVGMSIRTLQQWEQGARSINSMKASYIRDKTEKFIKSRK